PGLKFSGSELGERKRTTEHPNKRTKNKTTKHTKKRKPQFRRPKFGFDAWHFLFRNWVFFFRVFRVFRGFLFGSYTNCANRPVLSARVGTEAPMRSSSDKNRLVSGVSRG